MKKLSVLVLDKGSDLARRTEPTRPNTYFYLALYAFALVGLELVLLAVEPVLDLPPNGLRTQVVHWVLTILVWVVGAFGLVVLALRESDFGLRRASNARITPLRWLIITMLVAASLAAQWILQGGIFPPLAEHEALSERFGDFGTIAWIVQVAYYLAELVVIVLIIAFGQEAGERIFRAKWVPWGGFMLATTWGFVHFLTQDMATGIYGSGLSLAMGTIYFLTGKSLFITYPILVVIFIL